MTDDALLALALVGSRAPGFQHDAASKLQSLVMALEEMDDRAAALDDTALTVAVAAARDAVRELTTQLQAFRALTRRAPPSATPLRSLFQRAAERAGVRVHGEPPAIELTVSAAEVIHATALLLDGAAGKAMPREVMVAFDAHGFTVPAGASAEAIAVASYVYRRGGGELRTTPDALAITWSAGSS